MPVYEFRCEQCGHEFSRTMSISEHDQRGIVCPECGSDQVVQMVSSFTAQTSKKS